MNKCVITAAAVLSLLLAQAAAAEKTAGNITVLGDGVEFCASSLGLTGGVNTVDGALAGINYASHDSGGTQLEAGFYSRMVSSPPAFGYSAASAGGYRLGWTDNNPQGVTYETFVSTWAAADPYMAYYNAAGAEQAVTGLSPNTSFYNFTLANYMDGDYSVFGATAAVTLAAAVSSSTFRFEDVGHNTINLAFTAFSNPSASELSGWTPGTDYPLARYGMASVVYGSHVYVSGGFTGVYTSSAVYRGELGAAGPVAWQLAGFMKEGLYGHQLAAARGRLYVIGGRTQTEIRSAIWSAGLSTSGALSAWEPEQPLDTPLYFHSAAVSGDWLHISGGYSANGPQALIRSAKFTGAGALGAWVEGYSLGAPRYGHSMTVAAGRLYAAGGRDAVAVRGDVWAYTLAADGGIAGGPFAYTLLPSPRYGHVALAAGDALYIIGGSGSTGVQNTVFVSTLPAGSDSVAPWRVTAAAGPGARQLASGAVYGGNLYVFGGYNAVALSTLYSARATGTSYLAEASADASFVTGIISSGWTDGQAVSFYGLTPGTPYSVRVKARNRLNIETDFSDIAGTTTWSAMPGTAPWTSVFVTSAVPHWLANDNPSGTDYQVQWSSYSDYSIAVTTVDGQMLSYQIPEGGLQPNTTYYAKVRVLNAAAGAARYVDLPPVFTSLDPELDHSSPTVDVNMVAASPDWRSTNTFVCDVDLADNAGNDSGLAYFEVRAATAAAGAGGIVADWTPVVQDIYQGSYSQDWTVPGPVWELMKEGTSNYISIRVVDRAGNTTDYLDAFSVLKDTTPPELTTTYEAPAVVQTVDPGDIENKFRFTDQNSGLLRAEYSVSTNKDYPDEAVTAWTEISTPTLKQGATFYEPAISYDFGQLANATSNYFSFRITDMAGSTRVYTSLFGIGKSVTGPVVSITSPDHSAAYLSAFSAVSGTVSPTNGHNVSGTEVALYDASSGRFYNGVSFLAVSPEWFDAADDLGAQTFSYAFGAPPLVSGRSYLAVARSSDVTGDYSLTFSSYAFTYDQAPPSGLVAEPADGTVSSTFTVSGTASDPLAGISLMQASFRRLADGKWWGGSDWAVDRGTITLGNSPAWSWTFPAPLRDGLADGASYYFTVWGRDKALPANEGVFGVYGATFTYSDTTPPSATLSLAASSGGRSGAVRLNWRSAGDNGPNGYLFSGKYAVAYSTYAGAAVSTASPNAVIISTGGQTADTLQTSLVTGLEAGVSYYFTLWTADDALNWSAPSPEVTGLAGLFDSGSLAGTVLDASTQALTGLLVEALGPGGAVEGSDYTDAYGRYSITGLSSDSLSVRVTWAADDIESSVAKDQVASGSAGVNFRLSAAYQLASITGMIPSSFIPRGGYGPSAARYTTRAVRPTAAQAFVEIYRRGRLIGSAFTDTAGAFEVPNLLPGTYAVRVYNGTDYSRMENVKLAAGQRLVFTPRYDLVNKDEVYAYPNPANSKVNFHFSTNGNTSFEAEVDIFDIAGRLIKTLKNPGTDTIVVPSGQYSFVWDFSDSKLASGVYVYILRVKSGASEAKPVVKKFAVVR